MENNNNRIDRYFKARLGALEQAPPDAVWDTLAKKLEYKKKKGMVLLFFRIAAGMAILISTGIGFYLITKPVVPVKTNTISVARSETKSAIASKRPNESNVNQEVENQLSGSYDMEPERGRQAESFVIREPDQVILVQSHPSASATHDRNAYNPSLHTIRIHGQPRQILNQVPGELTPVDTRETRQISEAEALALLMADYEEPATDKAVIQRWSMGPEIAPLYSDRSISSDDMETAVLDNLNQHENGMLAYAGGIRIAYSTSKRLSVQSGLYYSRYGQEKDQARSYGNESAAATIEGNRSNSYITVTNSTGIITGEKAGNMGYDQAVAGQGSIIAEADSKYAIFTDNSLANPMPEETDISLKQVFDYLELPLVVKYKIIDRKFDFSFQGGLITNFLVGNSVNLVEDGESTRIGETTNINRVNYQGSFGMGFEYPIVSHFAITVEPRFRYYINPLDKSSRIDVHPFSFGIFAGISYMF